MNKQTIEDACRAACLSIGVEFKHVQFDGNWHTANLLDDQRGKNDGRIKVFPDGLGGIVWNHKSGDKQTFFISQQSCETLPPVDRDHIRRQQRKRQTEEKNKHDRAAKRAVAILQASSPAPANHPYLVKKQVKPHTLRAGKWQRVISAENGSRKTLTIDSCLLLPLYNSNGEIRSLQAIFPEKHPILERDKDFLPSGGLAGLFWWLGSRSDKVLICEGFATAATLHEETGYRVYMAFTANNLLAVGRIVRSKLPNADIVFCADNDTKTIGNPGVTKANEAAADVGGVVSVPPVHGDFNDYAIFARGGL